MAGLTLLVIEFHFLDPLPEEESDKTKWKRSKYYALFGTNENEVKTRTIHHRSTSVIRKTLVVDMTKTVLETLDILYEKIRGQREDIVDRWTFVENWGIYFSNNEEDKMMEDENLKNYELKQLDTIIIKPKREYVEEMFELDLKKAMISLNMAPNESVKPPSLLPGEEFVARSEKDDQVHYVTHLNSIPARFSCAVFITNYRIFVVTRNKSTYEDVQDKEDPIVPLSSISYINYTKNTDAKQSSIVDIWCKSFRLIRLEVSNTSSMFEKLLNFQKQALKQPFAKIHFESLQAMGTSATLLYKSENDQPKYEFKLEERRILGSNEFYDVNENFEICPSFPPHITVLVTLKRDELITIASNRHEKRFPAIVWKHSSGALFIRSGAVSGKLEASHFDTIYLTLLSKCTGSLFILYEECTQKGKPRQLEETQYQYQYLNWDTQNLANSFTKLTDLCKKLHTAKEEDYNWNLELDQSEWMKFVAQALRNSLTAAELLENGSSVIVIENPKVPVDSSVTTCLISLALLLVDSHYRTILGFEKLLRHHWLRYSHSFSCTMPSKKKGEEIYLPSFIFYLFMDAVHQLIQQFPHHFEFNEDFLITIMDHSHSNLFEDFLFNNEMERKAKTVTNSKISLWSELKENTDVFQNHLFDPQTNDPMLAISAKLYALKFWDKFYMRRSVATKTNFERKQDSQGKLTSTEATPRSCTSCGELQSQMLDLILSIENLKEEYQHELERKDSEISISASGIEKKKAKSTFPSIRKGLKLGRSTSKKEVDTSSHPDH